MRKQTMKLYDNKVYGEEVSDYGLKNGHLDYVLTDIELEK